jgi:hypothetical protein
LRLVAPNKQATSLKSQASTAALAAVSGCLLYLYVPLRAPAWMNSWRAVWDHISGASLTATWLDLARLRADGLARPLDLAARFVWPQLLPIGAVLALLGILRLLRRDRASAALLVTGYMVAVAFCAAYYVADVEVFFIPAHVLAAVLLGEGAMLLLNAGERASGPAGEFRERANGREGERATSLSSVAPSPHRPVAPSLSHPVAPSLVFLTIPILLLAQNLAPIRALNTSAAERTARAIMAQPMPQGALVVGNWFSTEGPRYLQSVEGLRPDIQFGSNIGKDVALEALRHGRAVYLVEPDLGLGLEQWPDGRLWRVGPEPIATAMPASICWNEGIVLEGYTLRDGQYAPGDAVPLMLQWQAQAAPQHGYRLFVHLVAEDGTLWGQSDLDPAQAPTDQWQPGGRYADLVSTAIKPDAPAGRYRVNVGWYEYPSMRRLGLSTGAADYVTLGEIVIGSPR